MPRATTRLALVLVAATSCSNRGHPARVRRDAGPRPDAVVSDARPTSGDASVPTPASVGPRGVIEGTVYLDGPLRRSPPIRVDHGWADRPGCRDAALRMAQPFDVTAPGLFPGALIAAEAHDPSPGAPVDRVVTFRDCDIVPRVTFARVNDRLIFHPDTRQLHMPRIAGAGATIDQLLIPANGDMLRPLPQSPGRYPIHMRDTPDFVAVSLLVLANRFITTSDFAGHFRMDDVPVGLVTVHAWYPGTVEARNVLQIEAGRTSHVEFHLRQAPPAPPPVDAGSGPVPQ